MKTILLIQGGRVVDAGQNIDKVSDLIIENAVIKAIGENLSTPEGAKVLDASGLVVCPGFIDLHCHLREPGYEHKETFASGTQAALKGGFTTVCAMPNTIPPMDTRAVVEFAISKSQEEGFARMLPIGCVTKGSEGKELSDMGELHEAGVIAFSDDGRPVYDANIMRQALSYSSNYELPIINHCEVLELSKGGSMNEGWISNRLGIKGIPPSAEEIMASRDIALAEMTGGKLHIAHISTAGTLSLVREAKDKGINVTCEVTPHHLTLSEEAVLGQNNLSTDLHAFNKTRFSPLSLNAYDTNAKVNPPLRSQHDVEAMIEGLLDGTIDLIATDHAPHDWLSKFCTFDDAAFGISGFETTLGALMSLVHSNKVSLPLLINKLTTSPARFLKSGLGSLRKGATADVVIINPDSEWLVDSNRFTSTGKNTPINGVTLKGKVVVTILDGEIKYIEEVPYE